MKSFIAGSFGLAFCVAASAQEAPQTITTAAGGSQVTTTDLGLLPGGTAATAGIIPGLSPHVYNNAGTFKAALSVTDALGSTGKSSNVTVKVR